MGNSTYLGTPCQDHRFGIARGAALAGSEVWYRAAGKYWRNRAFGIFSWQDLKFGTRSWANLEVWYLRKPRERIATRHFFGRREPNRRSWRKSGNQTSISARATPPEEPNGLICQSCRHRRASLKYLCETRRGEGVCVTIARAFKGARRVRAHCSSETRQRRAIIDKARRPLARPYGGNA